MPDNPAALDSLGWVRFRRGDARGATPHARARLSTSSHDARDRGALGRGAVGERQAARPRARCGREALARDPDSKAAQGDDQPASCPMRNERTPAGRRALVGRARDARRLPHRSDRRLAAPAGTAWSVRRPQLQALEHFEPARAGWRSPPASRASTPSCAGRRPRSDAAHSRRPARRGRRARSPLTAATSTSSPRTASTWATPRRARSSTSTARLRPAAHQPAVLGARRARPGRSPPPSSSTQASSASRTDAGRLADRLHRYCRSGRSGCLRG